MTQRWYKARAQYSFYHEIFTAVASDAVLKRPWAPKAFIVLLASVNADAGEQKLRRHASDCRHLLLTVSQSVGRASCGRVHPVDA
jgi:hypothetical protein